MAGPPHEGAPVLDLHPSGLLSTGRPPLEPEWSEEAHRLLLAYRRSYDYEGARRVQNVEVLKRPFEMLETAFQFTCQLMVTLIPLLHPVLHRISTVFRIRPLALNAPSMAVLVAGLRAKLAVDLANLWSIPPFRWVEPRPPPTELLHPLSMHGVELNLLSTLAGVSIGRLLVALRHGLVHLAASLSARLPTWFQLWAVPPLRQAYPGVAISLHVAASSELAPLVVAELMGLLRDAQLRRQLLLPTAARACWRRLWPCKRQGEEGAHAGHGGACCWEGVEDEEGVPHDLLCPITRQLFVHPVVLHGVVFEGAAVRQWVEATRRHPTLQGIWCHVEEVKPAPDVEALCHRLAAERGWLLSSERKDPDRRVRGC
mmetsp:Transcript_30492/g.87462  ORF Transcript_30492/g.87462 Transcript_30492/m.87462 type:complete len:371 (+) Transcript_30492:67-1179(+)